MTETPAMELDFADTRDDGNQDVGRCEKAVSQDRIATTLAPVAESKYTLKILSTEGVYVDYCLHAYNALYYYGVFI